MEDIEETYEPDFEDDDDEEEQEDEEEEDAVLVTLSSPERRAAAQQARLLRSQHGLTGRSSPPLRCAPRTTPRSPVILRSSNAAMHPPLSVDAAASRPSVVPSFASTSHTHALRYNNAPSPIPCMDPPAAVRGVLQQSLLLTLQQILF